MAHHIRAVLRAQGTAATVLSLDDLYDGWSGLNPSLAPRVLQQVLVPLAGNHTARWQAYDWAAGAFGAWHDLAPVEVLVLEGCGAGAVAFSPYLTLLGWMETDLETAGRRMIERDGHDVLEHLAAWRAAEQRHFARNQTRARADVVIAT
jgi:hypothetical protein